MAKPNLDALLEMILENAKEDRATAFELLEDLKKGITMPDNHVTHGDIAQKYLSKIQRSTDHLLKAYEVLAKQGNDEVLMSINDILEEDAMIDTPKPKTKTKAKSKPKSSEKTEEKPAEKDEVVPENEMLEDLLADIYAEQETDDEEGED